MLKRESVTEGLKKGIGITNTPIAKSYLRYLLEEVKEIEDALFDFLDHLDIDQATGQLLDYIGAMIGAYRRGSDDNTFRDAIRFQITVNTANGTTDNVLEVVRVVTGSDHVTLTNSYPASFDVLVHKGSLMDIELFEKIAAAGVGNHLATSLDDKQIWIPSEEGFEQPEGILPETDTGDFMIAEELS